MSKKSRRTRSRSRVEQQVSAATTVRKTAEPSVPSQAAQIKILPDSSKTATIEVRYRHIIPELRRITIIAGSLFVLLIILTIFIS